MPTFTPLVSIDDLPGRSTAHPGDAARHYLVRHSELLVDNDGTLAGTGAGITADGEETILLGHLDGLPCKATGVAADTPAPAGLRWASLLELGGAWSYEEWMIAGRAVQLVEWRRTSRFCGRCASPTTASPSERSVRCGACGLLAYPRIAPAVIVLVRRGDEALLAAGRGFRGGMYSALAGFVEPGEDLEEAVKREVEEEVGITLRNVTYVASQPWPFPHSLMVAFRAEWAGGDLRPDGAEILDARWCSVDDLPPIPPSMSIARTLIDQWVSEVAGASERAS